MDHVQILVLVPCFVLLNLEKTKRCLWCAFFYGINFLRNQAALLMVEHCRRQRRHNPSSTQPLLLETSKTKPFLVRDPLQWPKKSRRVFLKTTASDGKLNSYQAGRNRFSDKWLTSLAQFCLFCRFLPRFYPGQLCRRCVWRFVCFGQNLSGRHKPSALMKRWRWQKICWNKQLFC